MRLVVFGGSFDPVHEGHVAMANAAHEFLAADLLLWVPSYHAPHKTERPPQSAHIRVQLLHAVVEQRVAEELCMLEIERQGFSFTVDTLRQLDQRYAKPEVTLLLGADSLHHLLTWRDVPELFRRAAFAFVPRPGWSAPQLDDFIAKLPPELVQNFRARFLPMQEVAVSSTAIRAALAQGVVPQGLPKVVSDLIREQGSYRFTKA